LLDANLHCRSSDAVAAALAGRRITGYGSAGLKTSFNRARVLAKPLTDQQLLAAAMELAGRGN
jgi:hypothetical protein